MPSLNFTAPPAEELREVMRFTGMYCAEPLEGGIHLGLGDSRVEAVAVVPALEHVVGRSKHTALLTTVVPPTHRPWSTWKRASVDICMPPSA